MPELEKEIENRSAGELVGPFRSNLGFHLVKVEKNFLPPFCRSKK